MFKINDYVMYGSMGVCQIIDISKEKYLNLSSDETEFYVLQTVYNNKMTIKTPVNNPKVSMREIITKDDVLSLISTISETETMWVNDDRKRNTDFRAALRRGTSEDYIKIIKTLYLEKKEKSAAGKKLRKMDEEIMKAAEKQLYEEFAIALNLSPSEVVPFILNNIS
ncbi:transcriptional regulator, CarD family [Peptoclostridium litorale DSM 5388]|uniref:CarD-like transcriptional regulator n=1 Tax=Peptoclostridium litorale DSM 5388 TaxID=1121324 RepID=A0A069RIU8_PEPLI|nr:CarD family transcriptional regulator [Peptoclostridium litorale]KDR96718.1 CarD-like transcriptional regulator [Peptoclostridium litorale DSM 5388]SIN67455.1 transcriptional regulator, CarD family [Peptoclostridium litorale DSM 5388]